jgi:serine phosphatase RsbU (regulator of sigma subunit)
MPDQPDECCNRLSALDEEMGNLRAILETVYRVPTDFSLERIDICGGCYPVAGAVGGDHIVFVDFKRRFDLDRRIRDALRAGREEVARELEGNRDRIGVLLADVAGHQMTDALLAAMLDQAFLVGVLYELEMFGEVTPKLFEILNTRFYDSSAGGKYLTMVYGEITENGTFRFVCGGHPRPMIFSAEFDRFVAIGEDRLVTVLPIGMFPTEGDVDRAMNPRPQRYAGHYTVNEVNLMGPGDILLLATDGVLEHARDGEDFAPHLLEQVLRTAKHQSSAEILATLRAAMLDFAPQQDDMSLVVIKKK